LPPAPIADESMLRDVTDHGRRVIVSGRPARLLEIGGVGLGAI
jgi:hypothetical protein